MAYTVNQLISGAFYASGVVSREFETVTGTQVADGLIWLNELIGKKVIEPDLIPYEGETTFTGVVGQEDYSISDLIKVDTLTFIKDSVRYPMTFIPRNQYRVRGELRQLTLSLMNTFMRENLAALKYHYIFNLMILTRLLSTASCGLLS